MSLFLGKYESMGNDEMIKSEIPLLLDEGGQGERADVLTRK